MALAKLVPSPISDTGVGDAVLELAFLMSAVDGHLADEELAAFRDLVSLVRGAAASQEDVDALLERFVLEAHGAGVDDRLRTVATDVTPEHRETAFKVAVGFALADAEEDDHEDEMAGELAEALGLADRAVALAVEVREALAS